jgi:hypothetical protein
MSTRDVYETFEKVPFDLYDVRDHKFSFASHFRLVARYDMATKRIVQLERSVSEIKF